jgi:type I restriction-modification system DNA methylase subunit
MNTVGALKNEIEQIGYLTIENDYIFSDVFEASGINRTAPLVAFTHAPPSYRNAALAVVEAKGRDATQLATEYRALGAPLLFVIEDQQVTVWEIHPHARPTIHSQARVDQLSTLFAEHRDVWRPQRIQNAKSFSLLNRAFQLDFIDIGLLPAIEGEIHGKLDRLLNETLAETVRLRVIRAGEEVNDQLVFRTIFRLLAAKVLQDRGHELAGMWNSGDIDTVLKGISKYYKLSPLAGESGSFKGTVFEPAWARLRDGINFRNISSDDLAFVYESTLVTEETRKHFGVHSTPRPVAEYVVSRLQMLPQDVHDASIYEPFAGAGVFMVAALRRLRDLLPVEMTERERHQFLVNRIRGDEIEPFACEVATLSLILADYPNENGWGVSTADLFKNNSVAKRAKGAAIVLCNPPFEKFTLRERLRYPEATARSPRKPIAVLDAIIDAKPSAVGFVLPESFIDGPHYRAQRERIEQQYKDIEIVSLPDRIFKQTVIRSSLLIAQEARQKKDTTTAVRSTVVSVQDRDRFLKSGDVTESRSKILSVGSAEGRLWIDELDELWESLSELPKLETVADVHRGIEWQDDQHSATRAEPRQGFRPGIHSSDAIHVFALSKPVYLDCRANRLRGGAINHPWTSPKILANAARISRGPWCFAAAIDEKKLIASQQLFGIWPRLGSAALPLNILCAILNNPVAVAYIASHSPPDRIRVGTVKSVPIPLRLPANISGLVQEYLSVLAEHPKLFTPQFEVRANQALHKIDAAMLEAYDLSPRLERRVLDYFKGVPRPTLHEWRHWLPEGFKPYIPLHRYLSDEYKIATSGRILETFRPLPEHEAAALRDYMD